MKKRILSALLALCICAALLPPPVAEAYDEALLYPRSLLHDVYVEGTDWKYQSRGWNFTTPSPFEFFTDKAGNFSMYSHKQGKLPVVYTFDADYKVASKVVIKLPAYDTYGGFLAGSDGNYYFAVGYNNTGSDGGAVSVQIHQVSPTTGEVLKTGSMKGKQFGSDFKSFYKPFEAGVGDMVQQGDKIYLYMAHTMFDMGDGKHHQGSNLFMLDLNNMQFSAGPTDFYVSHSFNQILEVDNGNLVAVAHGDGFPRGMQIMVKKGDGSVQKNVFLRISGGYGENKTGSTVTGLEFGANNYLAVGNSVTHDYPINGVKNSSENWDRDRNIYLSVINKNTLASNHIWLTTFNPRPGYDQVKTEVGEPQIIKVADNRFAVLYSVSQGTTHYLEYKLVDETGAVLATQKFDKSFLRTPVTPHFKDGKLIWISPWFGPPETIQFGGGEVETKGFSPVGWTYLFEMDVKDPMKPFMVEGVAPKSIELLPKTSKLYYGDGIQMTAKVLPANSPFDMVTWLPMAGDDRAPTCAVTKKGFITPYNDGKTAKAMVTSKTDPSVYAKAELYVYPIEKLKGSSKPISVRGPSISTTQGYYVPTYERYVMDEGATTTDPRPVVGNSNVAGAPTPPGTKDPKYTAQSSDPSVVTVKNGVKLYAAGPGTATITFRTEDDQFCSTEVVVTAPWKKGLTMTQKPNKLTYQVGEGFDTSGFEGSWVTDTVNATVNDRQMRFSIPALSDKIWGRGQPLTKTGTFDVKVTFPNTTTSVTYKITVTGKEEEPVVPFTPPVMQTLPPSVNAEGKTDPNATVPVPPSTTTTTAVPSATKLVVDGKTVAADAYIIEQNNYIKLRDLASMINGTQKNFEVQWDGAKNAITLLSASKYTPTKGDMAAGDGKSKPATPSTSAIYVDGVQKNLAAYLIGENNYFKLRDVMSIFDVYVGYDNATATATLDTKKGYGGTDTPATVTPAPDVPTAEALADGTYKMRPAANPKMDVCISGASKAENADLILWQNGDGGHREFKITAVGGGQYSMALTHSGMYVTAKGEAGSVVSQGAGSTFLITRQADGSYRIQESLSGLYIGVAGGVMENSSKLILWTEGSDGSQSFLLEKLP